MYIQGLNKNDFLLKLNHFNKKMRVIFCGTRLYIHSYREKIITVLLSLDSANTTIIHGGCSGVDKITDIEARKYGFQVEIFPADWKSYGKAAGPIRNKKMIDSGVNKVYAFPYPSLENSLGTKNMVLQAHKNNIPVIIFEE
jgi:hypothetical protein